MKKFSSVTKRYYLAGLVYWVEHGPMSPGDIIVPRWLDQQVAPNDDSGSVVCRGASGMWAWRLKSIIILNKV